MSIGSYDNNPLDALSALDDLLGLYPDDPGLLLMKLRWLDEVGRTSDRMEILERTCASPKCPGVFFA